MQKQGLVLVKCLFKRGGFPSELVFRIKVDGGELGGIASREYCFDEQKNLLTATLQKADKVSGYVAGLLLGDIEGTQTSRVYLPDSEVYDVANDLLVTNGELASVSLRS